MTRKKKRLKHLDTNDELRQLFLLNNLNNTNKTIVPSSILMKVALRVIHTDLILMFIKSQRCYGAYNWQARNQTNAIGAIHNNKLFAVGLYKCNINSQVFYSWVEQVLLPELSSNSIIVMDNATFHKGQDIQDLISKHNHTIPWLPPYSPNLNPIE